MVLTPMAIPLAQISRNALGAQTKLLNNKKYEGTHGGPTSMNWKFKTRNGQAGKPENKTLLKRRRIRRERKCLIVKPTLSSWKH